MYLFYETGGETYSDEFQYSDNINNTNRLDEYKMILLPILRAFLLLLSLYDIVIEVESKKVDKKHEKSLTTKSKTRTKIIASDFKYEIFIL